MNTTRLCYFCKLDGVKTVCDGPAENGRVRMGGPAEAGVDFIMVSGRQVKSGAMKNVCADHRAAVEAQRALGRHLGHAERQAQEANMINDGDTRAVAEDRAHRLPELVLAVLQSITTDEYALIQRQADMVVGRAHRGTLAHDSAIDNVIDVFCDRIAQAAFRDVSDDVAAAEAVFAVDRQTLTRGLSHLNINRTGQTARTGSLNGQATANGANDEVSGLEYGDFAGLVADDTTDENDTYTLAGLNLSRAAIAQCAFILSTLGTRDWSDDLIDASADYLIRAANYTPARPTRPGLVTPAPIVPVEEAAPVATRTATPAEAAHRARPTVFSPWA